MVRDTNLLHFCETFLEISQQSGDRFVMRSWLRTLFIHPTFFFHCPAHPYIQIKACENAPTKDALWKSSCHSAAVLWQEVVERLALFCGAEPDSQL